MSSSSTSNVSDSIRNKLENENHKRGPISDDATTNYNELSDKGQNIRGAKEMEVEDKEEKDCGVCILEQIFESGVCGKEVKARSKCVDAAENEEDLEKCLELHENMLKCIAANSSYYMPILEAIFKDANNQEESSNNEQSPAEQEIKHPPN